MQLRAADIIKLHEVYGDYMYYQCADSGYNDAACSNAFKSYNAKTKELGLNMAQAEKARAYGFANYQALIKLEPDHIVEIPEGQ